MQSIDDYQMTTNASKVYDVVINHSIVYPALGLSGEVGEFHEKIKKIFRDKGGKMTDADKQGLKLELGDIMWYVVVCAQTLGLKMSDVLEANLNKSKDRRQRNKVKGEGDNR